MDLGNLEAEHFTRWQEPRYGETSWPFSVI